MNKLLRRLFPDKEMRAYRKMYRRHRRELVKLAKKTKPFDYGWLHESVIMQIRHMYEYYTAGNNVWQSDESLNLLKESLKRVLDLNEELEHLWDNHEYKYIKNNDGSITCTDESIESYNQKAAREFELYEEIYSHIGEYIMAWWD